ncbi:hypothetical protein ACAW74_04220 [Fibrella sp. WM1]|uniref:hypothetical protein n=1 Tax=Fibrella musci TaxID=3242485 RepID=UPI00351FFC24
MIGEDVLLDKKQVLDSFQDLPDKVSSEELIERILFIRLINERVEKAKHTEGTPHDAFMLEFADFKNQLKSQQERGV